MRLEEYLIKHYRDPVSSLERGELITSIVLSGFDTPDARALIPENPLCSDLLQLVHGIQDETRRTSVLDRLVGNEYGSVHFVKVTTWLCVAVTVIVIGHSVITIYAEGDPSDGKGAVVEMAEEIVDIFRHAFGDSPHDPAAPAPDTPPAD